MMEIVGASESSVKRWKRALKEGGIEALKAKPHPGPKPRMNAAQKRKLGNSQEMTYPLNHVVVEFGHSTWEAIHHVRDAPRFS